MTIRDIISGFGKAPLIFAGPGFPGRYIGLPGREELVEHFARKIKNEGKVMSEYYSKARVPGKSMDLLSIAAGLIEEDYNARWREDPSIRHTDPEAEKRIAEGMSPFRTELAAYLNSFSAVIESRREEYDLLRSLCGSGISGFITTNYDTFLESLAPDFQICYGQGLLRQPVHGKGEILKLLGSVSMPESILITQKDYDAFDKEKDLLIRSLLPVFLEYPVIFMGFSTRNNAYRIIDWIASGLADSEMKAFENRFAIISLTSAPDPCVEIIDDYVSISDEAHFHVAEIDLPYYSHLYNELAILS
ncbi:MAG: SIR2 family protein [Clostridia bacterium]|nr:SIR2 family protein [Clostridia bacterium]